jgi:hypothetical protein
MKNIFLYTGMKRNWQKRSGLLKMPADKVDATRKKLPGAIYCTNENLQATLEKMR